VCSHEEIDLEESVKMDLYEFVWMDMCISLCGFRE